MEVVRPMVLGAVIVAGLLLLGCDVKFQRNTEYLNYLHNPVVPNPKSSSDEEGRQYDFALEHANIGGIFLPNANEEPNDEEVRISLKRTGSDRWELRQLRCMHFPEADLRHDGQAQVIHFTEGELVPYYGHLFRFTFDGDRVHLEDRSKQFPAELLPAASSRVITLDTSPATLFRKRKLSAEPSVGAEDHFETIRLVEIDTDPEGIRAKIVRERMIVRNVDGAENIQTLEGPKEEWLGIGANLVVDDQLLSVKQIVPPTDSDDEAPPVGWIELELVDLSEVEMHRALL